MPGPDGGTAQVGDLRVGDLQVAMLAPFRRYATDGVLPGAPAVPASRAPGVDRP